MNEPRAQSRFRRVVTIGFSAVQDGVYVALGVLLAVAAITLLVQAGGALVTAAKEPSVKAVVDVLDRVLLALMLVELLYTVQVSFREHALVPEPFLLVALIAAVRRILVITAEFSAPDRMTDDNFRHVMWELSLLTVLIVVLVGALAVLRRHAVAESAPRSHHG